MLQSLLGIVVLTGLAWCLSENRKIVNRKMIISAIAIQLILAWLLLKVAFINEMLLSLNAVALVLDEATRAGSSFVFGYLGGGETPFELTSPGANFILAFRALPILIVMSALSSLLFYWGVLPRLVSSLSWLLKRSMGIGGALGLGAAANIFVGMVEAPILIRPYLAKITRSELFAIMCCGMATIAGTMMVLYANIVGGVIEGALGHIFAASLISVPAALMVARLIVPETMTETSAQLNYSHSAINSMDAITQGTAAGIKLFLNVVSMLLVLLALVYLANQFIALFPSVDQQPLSLQRILGWAMAPVTWLMGIPWNEAVTAGSLMGTKTILNEFIAYIELSKLPEEALSQNSRLIMTYALCGFANFGSLGIMLGGLTVMVPERRNEIVALGGKSIVAGTISTCMTGAVVGIIIAL